MCWAFCYFGRRKEKGVLFPRGGFVLAFLFALATEGEELPKRELEKQNPEAINRGCKIMVRPSGREEEVSNMKAEGEREGGVVCLRRQLLSSSRWDGWIWDIRMDARPGPLEKFRISKTKAPKLWVPHIHIHPGSWGVPTELPAATTLFRLPTPSSQISTPPFPGDAL